MSELEDFFIQYAGGSDKVSLRAKGISYDPPEPHESFERYGVDGTIDLVDDGKLMVFRELRLEVSSRGDSSEYIEGILSEHKRKRIKLSNIDAREKTVVFYSGDPNNLETTCWAVHCNLPVLSD